MKQLGVYENILENKKISTNKLNNLLQNYQQQALQQEKEARKRGFLGEELADEFFNGLDEQRMLSFETDTHYIELLLGRYHDFDEKTGESEFGACYLVEKRNLDLALEAVEDFSLGEEETLIQALKTSGYKE